MSGCALLLAVAGGALAAPPDPVQLQLNYDGSAVPGESGYEETLANLIYPVAKGPLSMGHPTERLPVMLSLRGGNTNNITSGTLTTDAMSSAAKNLGFIGVSFNYPVVGPGEDYHVSAVGVGLLVQYLRANQAELNVDPERIFAMGRSYGTVVGHAVCLQEDQRDPQSPDPVARESSRPDYWIPRFGPSSLTCFSDETGAWASILNVFYYPNKTFTAATPEERLAESAFWWLLNPQLFAREETPPICVVYDAAHPDICGEVIDVHSGIFGDVMLEAVEEFAKQTGRRDYRERCSSVDTGVYPDPVLGILLWAIERLAEDRDGLFLLPPVGELGATGGSIKLRVLGAEPSSLVTFFTGTQAGTFPMPGCAELQGQILDFIQLGESTASGSSVASITFNAQAGLVGQTALFHAVDFANCEMSNVSVHVYY